MSLDRAQRRALLAEPAGWIALGFGPGLAPLAPGTVASAVAVLPWLLLRELPLPAYFAVLAVMFGIGIWACGRASRVLGISDHGALVWDEYIGQWLTLLPVLAAPWWWVVAGFFLFRLFDIVKPWPIRWAERRFEGGLGVMLDDVFAGVAAALVLAIAYRIFD